VFARHSFTGGVETVNFPSQLGKLLRVAEKVKEEGTEDRLRGIGSGNDDEFAIVDHNLEWYFFFFCAKFVGLRG